jgi:UDP:flavonoid glycosyltransferase YjiC (YdhE family)
MRVLFSTTAGTGHLGPLIPVASACAAAGHTVAVAAPGSFAAAVSGAGLDHLPFDEPSAELVGQVFARFSELTYEEANRIVLAESFGRLDPQAALPALTKIMSGWRPDVVVREQAEFASLVAAERAGIGQVQVAIMMGQMGPGILDILKDPLAELSTMAGLPAERGAELLLESDSLTSVPAALDAGNLTFGDSQPERPAPDHGRLWRFRTEKPAGRAALPEPWGDPADPLVYVSYGSVTASQPEFAPLYAATLDALADQPVRVLMTTGRGFDPANLGHIPPNSHVEQWWPQEAIMPDTDVVIGHGGFGTTMTALAAGVPQIVVALFAFDQAINAKQVAAVNAGVQLNGGLAAIAELPQALQRVLDDPAFAHGARAMAAEIAALPDIAECLPILEQTASVARGKPAVKD